MSELNLSEVRVCVFRACGNTGAYPVMPDGELKQCEFCHTEPNSSFNVMNKITTQLAEANKRIAALENMTVEVICAQCGKYSRIKANLKEGK